MAFAIFLEALSYLLILQIGHCQVLRNWTGLCQFCIAASPCWGLCIAEERPGLHVCPEWPFQLWFWDGSMRGFWWILEGSLCSPGTGVGRWLSSFEFHSRVQIMSQESLASVLWAEVLHDELIPWPLSHSVIPCIQKPPLYLTAAQFVGS